MHGYNFHFTLILGVIVIAGFPGGSSISYAKVQDQRLAMKKFLNAPVSNPLNHNGYQINGLPMLRNTDYDATGNRVKRSVDGDEFQQGLDEDSSPQVKGNNEIGLPMILTLLLQPDLASASASKSNAYPALTEAIKNERSKRSILDIPNWFYQLAKSKFSGSQSKDDEDESEQGHRIKRSPDNVRDWFYRVVWSTIKGKYTLGK